MRLKSISSFIASVLLIGFTIASGIIVYYFLTTLPKVQTTEVSSLGQQVISCAGGFFDVKNFNGIYRKAITIDNTANPNNLNDYQVLVTNPIYNETGLVLSLHFNEGSGTIAFDSSGNNNNGNLVNGPVWVDGKFGKALSFDGVDDYVDIPTFPSLNKKNITISFWIKPLNAGHGTGWYNSDTIIYIGGTTSSIKLGYQSTNKIWVDGWLQDSGESGVVPLNTWTHVVFVQTSTSWSIYLNGILSFTRTNSGTSNTVEGTVIIGSSLGKMGVYNFTGIIDEVRIYNRALSEEEIQALYQAKARLDYGDIRFTDSDGSTLLNYWQEADGRFWVKVPSIPASSTKTIYVYYGNPSANSLSNGDNTFDFFDDFDDGVIDTNKWVRVDTGTGTISETGGYLQISNPGGTAHTIERTTRTFTVGAVGFYVEYDFYIVSQSNVNSGTQINSNSGAGTTAYRLYHFHDIGTTEDFYIDTNADGTYEKFANYVVLSTGTWYKKAFIKVTTSINQVGIAGSTYTYTSSFFPSGTAFYFMLGGWSPSYNAGTGGYTLRYDNVKIRKYTSPEPLANIGNEENITINLISSGNPSASMGNQFTSLIYLTNGTIIKKIFLWIIIAT